MLRTDLAAATREATVAPGFIRPDYDGYSYHRIPGTLAGLLGVDVGPTLPADTVTGVPDDPSTVVCLFVDAYGWTQFARTHASIPFFGDLAERATCTPLTTVFPSETAACIPTIHTGLTPVEHGLLGWDAYDPSADRCYVTLPFEANDGGDLAIDRTDLHDGDQIYQALRDHGVDTHAVVPAEHRHSGVRADATFHGYHDVGGFAATLRQTIDATDDPAYVFAYYPGIDSAAHHNGPRSAAHDAQLAALGGALRRELRRVTRPDSVVCCLVADHGQVATPPAKNGLLSDAVLDAVRRDRSGYPIVTGGPRNIHLHLHPDADPETVRTILPDDTLVWTRSEALDAELWGPGDPGRAFDRNCGDLVAVPRQRSIGWKRGSSVLEFEGMHGGLHEDELLVPFAPARLADLV